MNKRRKYDLDLDDDDTQSDGGIVDLSAYKINVKKEDEDDSGADTAGLSVEQLQAWLAALQTKELRNGQKKFGAVPDTEDPLIKRQPSYDYDNRIKKHPLLARTQRFSGDDPKLTARASENNKAAEEYMKAQLRNELRKQHQHQYSPSNPRSRVTLRRGG